MLAPVRLDAPLRLDDLPPARRADEAFLRPALADRRLAALARPPAFAPAFRADFAAVRPPDDFFADEALDFPDERDLPDLVAAAPPTFFAMIAPSVLPRRTRW
jgi:hypothetical protein